MKDLYQEVINSFNNYIKITEIARIYKISVSKVYYILKKSNINYRKNKDLSTILNKANLAKKYNELCSLKAVGKYFNTSYSSIKKYMIKYDIPFKKQIKYLFTKDYFKYYNKDSFYWAGFLAADGCVKDRKSKNGNRIWEISLELSNKDLDHLYKFKNSLNSNHKVFYKEKTNSSNITLVSEEMVCDLKRFNIVPRKTFVYTIPDFVKNSNLVSHFIRGYIDGDGSYYYANNSINIEVKGTYDTLLFIKEIFDKIVSKKTPNKIRKINSIYSLCYGGNICVKEIVNYLYKDASIYLERKYNKIKELIDLAVNKSF